MKKTLLNYYLMKKLQYSLECCVNSRKQQVEPCGRLSSVFYNPVKWGFPYYIGYGRKKYSSNAGRKNLYIEYVKSEFSFYKYLA